MSEENQVYQVSDAVISPSHYKLFGRYEVKHLISDRIAKLAESKSMCMLSMADSMELAAWYKDAIKYLMRWHSKDGVQDLKKAVECIYIMINILEKEDVR